MNADALSVDSNPTLSPTVYQMDEESKRIISYIQKSAQIILQSRQLLNNHNDDKKEDDEYDINENNFQLNISNCNLLMTQINDKYLSNWNPRQSSLTFTIDISLQIQTKNEKDAIPKSQLIEQWKIVFNHGNIHFDAKKNKKKKKKIDIERRLQNQMAVQLRSLLSYIQLLPAENILPPSTIINTLDLFNLGIDVESDEDLATDANNAIPYILTYRLSSAYEQATTRSFPFPESSSKLQKKSNNDGNAEKSRFNDYNEVDYYLFTLLEFGEIGSLQLSIFYINNVIFNDKFIANNESLSRFISSCNAQKKKNNKYLTLKVDQYMEEKQQQQIVLSAIAECKNIDINDEERALYVDEDEYENDKLLSDESKPLLPPVTIMNKRKEKVVDSTDKKSEKKKTFFDKMMDGMSKIKINVPRPCNLCIQILTQNTVKIGWKSDKSLKDYNSATNQQSKKFKFEIRSKKVVKKTAVDNDEKLQEDAATKMIENRPVMIRETFAESMSYNDLQSGQVYKFQVRILDNKNNTYISKWSATLAVVTPGGDLQTVPMDATDERPEIIPKDHQQMVQALKLEELQTLCCELLKKVTFQQAKIAKHDTERIEWQNTLLSMEKEKDLYITNLNIVQRSLRIKSNQFNEQNDGTEGSAEIALRKKAPNISSLVKQWNDIKLDVHLRLWVYLCDELMLWFGEDANKRSRTAFEILFHIVMHCYAEMVRQEQILGDFEEDAVEEEKEITSHDILCNMDICFDNNETMHMADGASEKRIYWKFCHRIVDTVIVNALRDKKSKWSKFDVLGKKDIAFALNDFICECCRIIWCLLCLSKDSYKYILYPTQFEKVGKRKKMKMSSSDMEFGIDNYGDFDEIEMNEECVVESAKSISIDKMDVYDERLHKKEMGSANNEKHIEYCSWPSIVKAYPDSNQESSGSTLFARLTNNDINSKEEDHQFLTRAFVFCCL